MAPRAPGTQRLTARAATALAAGLVLTLLNPGTPAKADGFEAGNIVSDAVFYDSSSMTASQIDAFLQEKGSACVRGGDGTPCLKDYRETTWTRTSTVCSGVYQGAFNESAGTIIAKVARACEVNPRVLLVTLQKEQSLITASGSQLYPRRYQIAMGFGCPDSAPCDAQYYGFYNQVYSAAQQFQRYRINPVRYGYVAGTSNRVGFHPDTARCGSSMVYITNQATAGLYNYTPYQPNAAILGGTPDSCSSYGNYNFWRFFTQWFGSTRTVYTATGEFAALWNSIGGSSSVIGVPVSHQQQGIPAGGSYQEFSGGAIYSSPASGTQYVTSAFRSAWRYIASERGVLGYPVTGPIGGLRDGGSFQNFQGGQIHYSPATGAVATYGAIRSFWVDSGFEAGPLGYPRNPQGSGLPSGGSYQEFERGSIYTYPGGTFSILGAKLQTWGGSGYERGYLGYPTTLSIDGLRDSGSFQNFQGGAVYTGPTGSFAIANPIRQVWSGHGSENGWLGYPTTSTTVIRDGGFYQHFEGGSIYSSTRGTYVVTPEVLAAWSRQGYENGPLGYPVTSLQSGIPTGGTYQDFEGGSVYTSPTTGTWFVARAMHAAWGGFGWERGVLGYPTSDSTTSRGGGSFQHFQGGALYVSSASGPRVVMSEFYTAWSRTGAEQGFLGYPSSNRQSGLPNSGSYQDFEGGAVYSSPASGTFAVSRAIWNAWSWTGWERGTFGYPVGEQQQVSPSVISQQFEGGTIFVQVG